MMSTSFDHCTYCSEAIHEEDSEGNKRFDFKTVRKYYEDRKIYPQELVGFECGYIESLEATR